MFLFSFSVQNQCMVVYVQNKGANESLVIWAKTFSLSNGCAKKKTLKKQVNFCFGSL